MDKFTVKLKYMELLCIFNRCEQVLEFARCDSSSNKLLKWLTVRELEGFLTYLFSMKIRCRENVTLKLTRFWAVYFCTLFYDINMDEYAKMVISDIIMKLEQKIVSDMHTIEYNDRLNY